MKYGIKSILRTPVKSFLFFLLIAVITSLLSFGLGMWDSAGNMLEVADNTFMTAGEFSGNSSGFEIKDYYRDEILMMEENIVKKAYAEGYVPARTGMAYTDYAILSVSVLFYDSYYDAWYTTVSEVHYSERDMINKIIYIMGDTYGIEKGKYVICGKYDTMIGSAFLRFDNYPLGEILDIAETADVPTIINLSDWDNPEDFWQSNTGECYKEMADVLHVLNHSIDLSATRNIEAVSEFHRGEYTLIEGSFFTDEDYINDNVCIIPYRVASQKRLSVGDTINLSVHFTTVETGLTNSHDTEAGAASQGEYTVVGIYGAEKVNTPIYIPNVEQSWLGHREDDYVLARVVLDNRTADKYEEEINKILPEGVEFSMYDQGYKAAVIPILSMRQTALMVIVACVLAAILILWFFAYFFIYSNMRNIKVLLALGAGYGKTMGFLAAGSGVIAFLAAAAGCVIGYFVSGSLMASVYSSIEERSVYDFRFSINGYGVKSSDFSASPEIDFKVYILLAVCILGAALLLCCIYGHRTIIKQNAAYRSKRRGRKTVTQTMGQVEKSGTGIIPKNAAGAGFTLKVPWVSLRYALKSTLRGGGRSLAVPVIFIGLLLLLCMYSSILTTFQNRLDTVYEDIPVSMQFTDITGRWTDNLTIYSDQIDEIEEAGFAEKSWYSYNMRYVYLGVSSYADGTPGQEVFDPVTPPEDFYGYEIFMNQLNKITSPLCLVSDIGKAPDFYYSGEPKITWMDGFDDKEFYLTGKNEEFYCLVPEEFLSTNELSLGDTIALEGINAQDVFYFNVVHYVIAGIYSDDTSKSIYIPSNMTFSYGISDNVGHFSQIYRSAGFLLQNTRHLSELKSWLEGGYDQVGMAGSNRRWIMIDDAALYGTIDNLTRYTDYMKLLYPIIYMLVIGIGFLVSNLLIKSRTGEIAVLRIMGTKKAGIFFSFFLEPLILSIPAIVLALTLSALVFGWEGVFLQNAWLFTVCYYLGASVAIIRNFRKAAIQALGQRED